MKTTQLSRWRLWIRVDLVARDASGNETHRCRRRPSVGSTCAFETFEGWFFGRAIGCASRALRHFTLILLCCGCGQSPGRMGPLRNLGDNVDHNLPQRPGAKALDDATRDFVDHRIGNDKRERRRIGGIVSDQDVGTTPVCKHRRGHADKRWANARQAGRSSRRWMRTATSGPSTRLGAPPEPR